ncbi:MAG: DUF3244 domain-containing protein [Bacteroidales bacterium]|nr:DUF3244 domain-containing protein [Bacteroidales bacterium]
MLLLITMTVCCNATTVLLSDKHSDIQIKHTTVQGVPKDSSIQATIDGHTLTVVFLENLGQVQIQVETALGGDTQYQSTPTPNGVIFNITNTGSYIVTFTLPNGDEYYGEFEVSD